MNEDEKKVFAALSEEDQKKVAGGETIDGSTLLTEKQCDQLKKLFEEKPLLEEEPAEHPHKPLPYILAYGFPSPPPLSIPHKPSPKREPSQSQE